MPTTSRPGATQTAEVAVIGMGAMGAATLYQLAKRGVKALGIDRFDPPHAEGSSHGGSRVTREAVGEGPAYVPFVRRTHQILAELEQQWNETLLVKSGTLIVGSTAGATPLFGKTDFLANSVEMAQRFGIEHEMLDADELRRRYPQFLTFRETDRGYLEPRSGYIRPEAAIAAQLRSARALGATTLTDTVVTSIRQSSGVVRLETSAGSIEAKKVVVTAGAWTRDLLGPAFARVLAVTRQTLHWYAAPDYGPFAPERFPTFIWFVTDRLEDYFTGFPVTNPAEGVKMTASVELPDIDLRTVDRRVSPDESAAFYNHHVGPNLAGITPQVVQAKTCYYTSTPDKGFIIDAHPDMDRVMVVSACSGHGFKHSLGIGETVAEQVSDGRCAIDLAPFQLGRFFAAAA